MTGDAVLILAGPTASGKTALAVELANRFDAEIVNADSRQVYRGMEIGTAAPTPSERAAASHHLVGFLDPNERYSAARFASDALDALLDIRRRGKRAIVVGGTGFYLRALRGGVSLASQYDEALRERLASEARLHPPQFLHEWLRLRDARRAAALDPNDTYRVVRALEIALAPDAVPRGDAKLRSLADEGFAHATVVLDVPLEELDARIARRTAAMLDAGFLEEAERIGVDAAAANAVGYPQALAFLRGWCTERELRATLERATRRYARRQRGWFRSEPEVRRLVPSAVEQFVRENLRWLAKR